jgi:hypothetical protein
MSSEADGRASGNDPALPDSALPDTSLADFGLIGSPDMSARRWLQAYVEWERRAVNAAAACFAATRAGFSVEAESGCQFLIGA